MNPQLLMGVDKNKQSPPNRRLTSFVCWKIFQFLSAVFVTYSNLPKPLGRNFSEEIHSSIESTFQLGVVYGEVRRTPHAFFMVIHSSPKWRWPECQCLLKNSRKTGQSSEIVVFRPVFDGSTSVCCFFGSEKKGPFGATKRCWSWKTWSSFAAQHHGSPMPVQVGFVFFFWGGLQAGVFRCKLPVAGDGKVVGTVRYRMQTWHENAGSVCGSVCEGTTW